MKRIEKISTVRDLNILIIRLELRQLVGEAFSKLWLESQQWDLPEGDRISPFQQRKERSLFVQDFAEREYSQ